MNQPLQLRCACGQVQLQVAGAPIVSAECCCTSCRTAGGTLQSLPSAPRFLEPHGSTRFELYRKDRVHFLEGTHYLKELRLTPEAKTRRVVATCCNTPVFLEFESGHWLSLYGCLWPKGTLPRLEMRTMASDLPPGVVLPDDVPNSKTQTLPFFAKLLGAWIMMGFRSPKLAFVQGALQR
ncbi:GFA family protein [Myxococcus sp. 1LA]